MDTAPTTVASAHRRARRTALLRIGIPLVLLASAGFVAGIYLLPPPKPGEVPAATEQTVPDATATPSAERTRGVTDTQVFFGMSAPFFGPVREYGRSMLVGIETCFRSVNDKGGVAGRKLYLLALDDDYEPDRARANMNELLDESRVFGLIGNFGTATAEVSLPIARAHRALFFGAYTGAQLLRHSPPDRYVFNYRSSYREETAAIVKYLVQRKKIAPEEIAAFAQNDGFGNAGVAGVRKAIGDLGGDPDKLLVGRYTRNRSNIEEAARQMTEGAARQMTEEAAGQMLKSRDKVKAVVLVATLRPAAEFIKRLKDADMNVIFACVSPVGPLPDFLRGEGPQYAPGVIVTQVVPFVKSNAAGVQRYRNDLNKYFSGEQPSFVSLEGYVAAQVLVEGLRRAGRDLTNEKLIDALERIQGLDLGIGTVVGFSKGDHQGSHKVWGTVVDQSGEFQSLELD
jgi:ABC-type branched-subunit amino acid transport system substrate-binding protein